MKRLIPLLLLLASPAFAQVTNFTVTFPASGGKVTPTLGWSNPTASSCTASGDTDWTTAYNARVPSRPISGTMTLPAISPPNARSYTLTCVFPGDSQAVLSWTAPTVRTDGSALPKCTATTQTGPCLAQFNLYRRLGSPDMAGADLTPLRDPNAVSRTFTGLGTGTHYFGIEVVDGDGIPSVMSAIVSKAITTGATDSETVSLAFPGTTILTVK